MWFAFFLFFFPKNDAERGRFWGRSPVRVCWRSWGCTQGCWVSGWQPKCGFRVLQGVLGCSRVVFGGFQVGIGGSGGPQEILGASWRFWVPPGGFGVPAVGLTFSRVSMRCFSRRFSVRRRWGRNWGRNRGKISPGGGADVPRGVAELGDTWGWGCEGTSGPRDH